MLALFRVAGIHVPQTLDFLAKTGEVFRDVSHLLNFTRYCQDRRFILLSPPEVLAGFTGVMIGKKEYDWLAIGLGVALVPTDPRMTWRYFALAVSQESDFNKLTNLLRQLHRALDQADPEADEVRAVRRSRP
jgi:hypothetical protein